VMTSTGILWVHIMLRYSPTWAGQVNSRLDGTRCMYVSGSLHHASAGSGFCHLLGRWPGLLPVPLGQGLVAPCCGVWWCSGGGLPDLSPRTDGQSGPSSLRRSWTVMRCADLAAVESRRGWVVLYGS